MEKIKKIISGTHDYSLKEESQDMSGEDRELYLFLRGGFDAK